MTKEFKYKLKNLSITNTLFLFLTPPAAILFIILWLYYDGFDYRQILLGCFFYTLAGLSITAGYHRLFSHRAYSAHPIVKFLFLIFGASAFQNSILKWASDHRIHHNKVDTDEDPYNINEGFFYAHMGWILLKQGNNFDESKVKDLMNDKLCMWQTKHYLAIAVTFGIILPALSGYFLFGSLLGGLAISAFLKVVLIHHSTFFINSLCHYIGRKPYTDSNSAKDSWLMAIFTFGEGYHNFHHYFQTDYRNGVKWFHFDPVKWLISVLAKFNLASKLKRTPNFKIISAQLEMRIQEVFSKYAVELKTKEEMELLRLKVTQSLKQFEDIKKQLKEKKSQLSQRNLLELKRKLAEAKNEFKYNLRKLDILIKMPIAS